MRRSCLPIVMLAWLCGNAAGNGVWIPAFPGAEGFGARTLGGRGGRVIEVTNLNDSGPGSFRAAVEASGPRTVVFRVGGTIELQSTVLFTNPFITIAGQTAPGEGIAFKNVVGFDRYTDPSASFDIRTHDVIIRYVRIRPGPGLPGTTGSEVDCVQIYDGSYNIILDHCSMSWAVDENFSSWGDPHDFTLQWCLIYEGLRNSVHSEGPHSMGALFGSEGCERVSFHHNLLAHNVDRSPRLKTSGVVDCVNNVVYNYGEYAGVFSADYDNMPVNYVGNYVKKGPDSSGRHEVIMWESGNNACSVYVQGNLGPHRQSHAAPESDVVDPEDRIHLTPTSHPVMPVNTSSAERAFSEVTATVGANLPVHDSADRRVLSDVLNGTGRLVDHPNQVGGWPVLAPGTPPADSDHDGMPDDWETQHGFDPANPADGVGDADGDGYTNLEEYLNGTNPHLNPHCGLRCTSYSGVSRNGATLTTAAVGQLYRTDRAYTITSLPSAYACSSMVAYAEDDLTYDGDEFISIELDANATVAVAYDARSTVLPAWLADWSATSQVVSGRETGRGNQVVNFNVRTRSFAAGQTVVLGGNRQGNGDAQSGYLVFIVPDCPRPVPSIIEQPQSQYGRPGGVITLAVQAQGAGRLSYQWQYNGADLLNGPRHSGVHSPVLTISGFGRSDQGSYRVRVSDDGCSTISEAAILSMATPCDYDGDRDVDQDDFGFLQQCLGSSANDPKCVRADLADTPEINAEDLAAFMQCLSGPNVRAADHCIDMQ